MVKNCYFGNRLYFGIKNDHKFNQERERESLPLGTPIVVILLEMKDTCK